MDTFNFYFTGLGGDWSHSIRERSLGSYATGLNCHTAIDFNGASYNKLAPAEDLLLIVTSNPNNEKRTIKLHSRTYRLIQSEKGKTVHPWFVISSYNHNLFGFYALCSLLFQIIPFFFTAVSPFTPLCVTLLWHSYAGVLAFHRWFYSLLSIHCQSWSLISVFISSSYHFCFYAQPNIVCSVFVQTISYLCLKWLAIATC